MGWGASIVRSMMMMMMMVVVEGDSDIHSDMRRRLDKPSLVKPW